MTEYALMLKVLASLGAVLLFMLVVLKLLQKFNNLNNQPNNDHRLKIESVTYLDQYTKIVSVTDQAGNNYVLAINKYAIELLGKNLRTK